ncbi:HEPN domain-containing protein [Nocardioides mesophilus]|uniref:Uncharacterized protein n=1 Tax=Nocardioides mesophilus TaxID=433659 RepID=A0A7G9RD87_9ACTN|nr:HEPN domain-containing protein [Nocardioides mesophilus]QNN53562.1 hypothetical protein H9L09_03805 [Nocardioides mesophilus]
MGYLREREEQGQKWPKMESYPTFADDQAGRAYQIVERTSSLAPAAYTKVFGPPGGYKTQVEYEAIPELVELIEFVREHDALVDFLVPPRLRDVLAEHALAMGVVDLPLEMVERHLHVRGWETDPDFLLATFEELASWWLNDELPVELVVPVMGVDFDLERVQFSDGCRIDRLSSDEHLARWPENVREEKRLLAMATHAFTVPGWILANDEAMRWFWPVEPPSEVEQVERFFEALATVSDAPSGYMQIVCRPVGWSPGYRGPLPRLLTGPLVLDRSSTRLDPGHEPLDAIAGDRLTELLLAYDALHEGGSVALAAERLLSAERRNSEADRVVDLCIGLEALLSDPNGETTYKIKMRTAAMLSLAGVHEPARYISAMSRVYAHRSAIVHGRKPERTRTVVLGEEEVPTEQVARAVLRSVLQIRIANPALTPERIDVDLIGAALNAAAKRVGVMGATGSASLASVDT